MELRIAQLGHPALRQVAKPVEVSELGTAEFQQFVDQMLETVRKFDGAGLAAPQVFESKRIFVASVLPAPRKGEPLEYEVMINPKLTNLSVAKAWSWEGCLSFLELLVYVPRHERVRIEFLDRQGQAKTLDLEGFPARVVQHEYDHLDGILTIDLASSTRDIIKASELDAVLKVTDAVRDP